MPKGRTPLRAVLLALSCAFLLPSLGSANFTITFDAQYSRMIDQAKVTDPIHHSNGMGGVLFLEFQPVDFLSLGGVFNFTPYFGIQDTTPDPTFSGYVDGVLRIMPFGTSERFSPYLLGTFGWNPNSSLKLAGWTGTYHAQAGLGFRWMANNYAAMDFGLTFQAYSPEADPLLLPSAHLGFTLFVDPVPLKSNKPSRLIPRYDSLQAIAGREYGNPDLYPILVDANFKDLSRPLTWKVGASLFIPRPLTPAMIRDALTKARMPLYLNASDTFHDPTQSAEYRKAARPTGSYWVPITKKKRNIIPFHAESLYDIAARPDVYGDPELYPLLVDGNKVRLQRNYPDKPFNLIIPKPTKELADQARLKAWSPEYGLWRGKDVTRQEYLKWRESNGKWVEP